MSKQKKKGSLVDKGGEKGKKKEKGRKANRGRKEKKSDRDRERKKWEIFSAFRLSKLDGPRRKVNPRIANYAWVSKSWSFVKLHEVGNFPAWIISSLKVI